MRSCSSTNATSMEAISALRAGKDSLDSFVGVFGAGRLRYFYRRVSEVPVRRPDRKVLAEYPSAGRPSDRALSRTGLTAVLQTFPLSPPDNSRHAACSPLAPSRPASAPVQAPRCALVPTGVRRTP